MRRGRPLRRRAPLRRSSGALKRSGGLGRGSPPPPPSRAVEGRRTRLPLCAVCGERRATHRHHVVYKQHVPAGRDKDDPRNLLPVCFTCHWDHHYHPDRRRRISVTALSAETLDLVFLWLGAAGYDYLSRYGDWPDERVEERLRLAES